MKRILYFSHVNWSWIKQRPHFIPYYIAKSGIEVTYISLNSITSFISNNKIKMENEVDEGNLKIKEINVLPLGSRVKIIGKINSILTRKYIAGNFDAIILTHPSQIDYITPKLRGRKIIYECMDNHPYFSQKEKVTNLLISKEKMLCEIANKIIVSSLELKKRLINRYGLDSKKIDVILNALDDDTILNCSQEKICLKQPNLVYIGTIGSWFDCKLIKDFAGNNPNYTVYLVGPIEKSIEAELQNLPTNIVLVGPVEHNDVFKFIRSGDIMLLPFKVNDVIECVDPVKMYEYIALNKPIVSSYWSELDRYVDKVHFYNDGQSFENVVKYIHLNAKENIINTEFVQKENWKLRVEDYLKLNL